MQIVRVRTATNGKMHCFATVTWADSKLPKRTVLFWTAPSHSSLEVRLPNHACRNAKRLPAKRSVFAGISGIASLLNVRELSHFAAGSGGGFHALQNRDYVYLHIAPWVATCDALVPIRRCHDSATGRISSNPAMQTIRGVGADLKTLRIFFSVRRDHPRANHLHLRGSAAKLGRAAMRQSAPASRHCRA